MERISTGCTQTGRNSGLSIGLQSESNLCHILHFIKITCTLFSSKKISAIYKVFNVLLTSFSEPGYDHDCAVLDSSSNVLTANCDDLAGAAIACEYPHPPDNNYIEELTRKVNYDLVLGRWHVF